MTEAKTGAVFTFVDFLPLVFVAFFSSGFTLVRNYGVVVGKSPSGEIRKGKHETFYPYGRWYYQYFLYVKWQLSFFFLGGGAAGSRHRVGV